MMQSEQDYLENLITLRPQLVAGSGKMIKHIDEVLQVAQTEEWGRLKIEGLYWRGWLHYRAGAHELSKQIYDDCLSLALQLTDKNLHAKIYNNRALALAGLGKREEAVQDLIYAVRIYEKEKNYMKLVGSYANIGSQYTDLGNLDKGEEYFFKAIESNEKLGEKKRKNLRINGNLAVLFVSKKEYQRALEYANLAIEEGKNLKDDSFLSFAFITKGLTNYELGNYEEALDNCLQAEEIATKSGLHQFVLTVKVQEAKIRFKIGDIQAAKALILEHRSAMKTLENKTFASETLYQIYKQEGHFEAALNQYEQYILLEAERTDEERKEHMATLEAKFQNELKEQEKEILRLQKIELEQKAIRAQLNPHFFFNSLNSVYKYLDDNEVGTAKSFLKRFSGLMRKTLENSESSFILIEDEIAYLEDYLQVEQLRFNHSFSYRIEADDEVEIELSKIPTMMVQPYVENCIKHGVNGVANGEIVIRFDPIDDDKILCTVSDNGRGRQANSASEHKSLGTKLLQDRIRAFKERYNIDCQVETTDLKNEKGEAAGTCVKLTIPDVGLIEENNI